MNRNLLLNGLILLSFGLSLLMAPASFAITQYAWPPPGSPTFSSSGTPAGSAGGLDWTFSAWNTAEYVDLYIGAGYHAAGLDGSSYPLSFAGISGQSISYTGTTPYTSPGGPGSLPAGGYTIDLIMTVTLTGYGATPWSLAGGVEDVATLDPTIGAVANITAGTDFTLNFLFEAVLPGIGTVALNDVQQPPPGGQTRSDLGTAWFANVPEPGTALLMGFGLAGLARHGRRD